MILFLENSNFWYTAKLISTVKMISLFLQSFLVGYHFCETFVKFLAFTCHASISSKNQRCKWSIFNLNSFFVLLLFILISFETLTESRPLYLWALRPKAFRITRWPGNQNPVALTSNRASLVMFACWVFPRKFKQARLGSHILTHYSQQTTGDVTNFIAT